MKIFGKGPLGLEDGTIPLLGRNPMERMDQTAKDGVAERGR